MVRDASGEPLAGCTVALKGTNEGTVTDGKGCYAIEVPTGSSRLEFSFLGFRTREVAVGVRNEINVTLEEDLKKLNEVVVVGYGTQRKALVTNAISSFKPNESNLRPVLSANELLQGRVAGVTVAPDRATWAVASG